MVTPPPSTRTRGRPRSARASRMAAGAIQPSGAGSSTTSTPAGRGRPQDWTTRRRDAVGAQDLGVVGQAAARVDHHPRRARALDQAHGQARVVAERGADAHHHRVGQRAAAVKMAQPVGAGDGGGVAAQRGDAAVERLADLCEEVGLAMPVRRQRRVERPGGPCLGGPVGARAGAPARPERKQRGPDLVRHLGALHFGSPLVPRHLQSSSARDRARKGPRSMGRGSLRRRRCAEGGKEAVAEGRHRPDRRIRGRDQPGCPVPGVEASTRRSEAR